MNTVRVMIKVSNHNLIHEVSLWTTVIISHHYVQTLILCRAFFIEKSLQANMIKSAISTILGRSRVALDLPRLLRRSVCKDNSCKT